jgi:predicted ATP-grasp superfamily ATP-dependent carboligase
MDPLVYQSRPKLRSPVLIAAFEGWNDAAEAATGAVDYLIRSWDASVFASIEPEEFFDFQVVRPRVRLNEEGLRDIVWPVTPFAHASIPGADRDAVLLHGIEPSMHWPTFCSLVADVMTTTGIEMVVTLGALLAGRPHTRPTRVTGTASTPELAQRYGLATPRYEGPTGITGVLMDSVRRSGIAAVGLWAWVPHYVQGSPSPKAALGLVQRLGSLLELQIDTGDLEEKTRAYEQRLDEAVQGDPDIAATVRELERQADAEDMEDIPSGEELVAEVERFLREQPRGDR